MTRNTFLLLGIFFVSTEAAAVKVEIPKLVFEYGIVSDSKCKRLATDLTARGSTREDVMKEAISLTPILQGQWDTEGAELLSALISIVGREYSRRELTVYTSVCGYGSRSSPLVVSIRSHMGRIKNMRSPISANIPLVLHEFTHKYLVESFDYSKSSILKEFSDSPALFKNHIHLMALIKASMVRAGKDDMIEPFVQSLKGRAYINAWKVGTLNKYYSRLIKEVKSLSGSNEKYWFFDPIENSENIGQPR